VALVHALGTGSDARTGWLGALAVGCTAAVTLSMLWRVGSARGGRGVQIGLGLAALAVPLGIFVWARSGPLVSGWAARAGTPKSVLAASRLAASPRPGTRAIQTRAAGAVPVQTLPTGSFRAAFRGRVREAEAQQGLVTVSIDGTARGGFNGRVHVALRGAPIDGGGVQMIDNSVGLLPRGASVWLPGRVLGLSGQQILTEVRRSSGRSARVLLNLQIDRTTGRATGLLSAGAPQEASSE
jgi:hypothetical protein